MKAKIEQGAKEICEKSPWLKCDPQAQIIVYTRLKDYGLQVARMVVERCAENVQDLEIFSSHSPMETKHMARDAIRALLTDLQGSEGVVDD